MVQPSQGLFIVVEALTGLSFVRVSPFNLDVSPILTGKIVRKGPISRLAGDDISVALKVFITLAFEMPSDSR